jgi:hypothetical protein
MRDRVLTTVKGNFSGHTQMRRDLMKIREILVELRERKRSLNRAIAALEALEHESRVGRRRRGKRATEKFEDKTTEALNGTTGVLIPFSRGRRQK